MTDFSEWVVHCTNPGSEADAGFFLEHMPCGQSSDDLDAKALSVLVQWADEHTCPPPREHALTWGQVPAGWEVRAPDGRWYRITRTRRPFGTTGNVQIVTMLGQEWSRDPAAPVTARGYDPAIEALGFPEVLEDGS